MAFTSKVCTVINYFLFFPYLSNIEWNLFFYLFIWSKKRENEIKWCRFFIFFSNRHVKVFLNFIISGRKTRTWIEKTIYLKKNKLIRWEDIFLLLMVADFNLCLPKIQLPLLFQVDWIFRDGICIDIAESLKSFKLCAPLKNCQLYAQISPLKLQGVPWA
jgi:hypothetical protein